MDSSVKWALALGGTAVAVAAGFSVLLGRPSSLQATVSSGATNKESTLAPGAPSAERRSLFRSEEADTPGEGRLNSCEIHLLDPTGQPISGASLSVEGRIVHSDRDGVATFPWGMDHDVLFVIARVTADGFVEQRVAIEVGASTARILMSPQRPLIGRVVLRGGSAGPAGMPVLYWQRNHKGPDKEALLSIAYNGEAPEESSIGLTFTDTLGEFILEDIAEPDSYFAVAGGLGLIAPRVTGFSGQEEELVLEVERAYGVCITFTTRQDPMAARELLARSGEMSWGGSL